MIRYGRVTGRFVSFAADESGGPAVEIPLAGTVTLAPLVGALALPTALEPVTAVAQHIVCPVVDGWLCAPGTTDPGVSVAATGQPEGEPNTVQWRAVLSLRDAAPLPPYVFEVPDGGEVDLSSAVPVLPVPGTVTVVSRTDALAAAASALAAQDALDAITGDVAGLVDVALAAELPGQVSDALAAELLDGGVIRTEKLPDAAVPADGGRSVSALGVPAAVNDLAEKALYVTPRGSDANDGLTLKTAKSTLSAALTALGGGGRVQLGYGSFTTADTHALSTGTRIEGCGPGLTTITYTGAGSLFANATPGTRIYHVRIKGIAFVGPGKTSTAVCIDLADISNAALESVNIVTFGVGVKNSSAVLGGAVYNEISGASVINSCGVGVGLYASGSNGFRFRGVKIGACTVGVDILDSNQNSIGSGCQLEGNTTGVKIDATLAGLSDHNSITEVRFEGNTTAWHIVSSLVRDTEIENPAIFGTLTYTDAGTRTKLSGSGATLPPDGTNRRYLARSGSYTLATGDDVVSVNATSATATLPDATAARAGRRYVIKNLHSTALTVNTTSSQTIDGSATVSLAQWAVLRVMSNGANWLVI